MHYTVKNYFYSSAASYITRILYTIPAEKKMVETIDVENVINIGEYLNILSDVTIDQNPPAPANSPIIYTETIIDFDDKPVEVGDAFFKSDMKTLLKCNRNMGISLRMPRGPSKHLLIRGTKGAKEKKLRQKYTCGWNYRHHGVKHDRHQRKRENPFYCSFGMVLESLPEEDIWHVVEINDTHVNHYPDYKKT